MPRKFRLYWDKHLKYWFKKFNGKKVYFGKGKSKYLDTESYNEAVVKYEEYLEEHRDKLAIETRRDHFRVDSKGERPINTIAGAIDRYYAMQHRRQKRGKISVARLTCLRSSMRTFERFCGTGATTKTYEPDGVKKHLNYDRMYGYFKHLENKVNKGEYVAGTAHQHWCISLDFLHYCYENEWINRFPRGLNRHKFNMRKNSQGGESIKVFSVKQIRQIFMHARDRMLYPMDLFISLALNCGFTSVDIATLKEEHLVWDERKENIIKIRKRRTKTNQYGEWRLWIVTSILLKRWLKKRAVKQHVTVHEPDYIFYSRSGRRVNNHVELVNRASALSRLHAETGYVYDGIGRSFTLMMKTHFPEMDGLSFKTLRKSGVSELVKLNLKNTLLIEQLYLAHKPISTARIFYSRIDADTLDDALIQLESVYVLGDMVEDQLDRAERKRLEHNAKKKIERAKRRHKKSKLENIKTA